MYRTRKFRNILLEPSERIFCSRDVGGAGRMSKNGGFVNGGAAGETVDGIDSAIVGHYMAFEASDTLHRNAEDFIQRFVYTKQPGSEPQVLLYKVMEDFINECMQVYFVDVGVKAGLSSGSLKVVETTVGVIRKAVGFVLGRVVNKLEPKQMLAVAQHMDRVMLRARGNLSVPAWIAFSLPEEWVTAHFSAHYSLHQTTSAPDVPKLISLYSELADISITEFFETPLQLIGLGPILRKMTDVAIDTARSATRGLLKQIFKNMSREQIGEVLNIFEAMTMSADDVLARTHQSGLGQCMTSSPAPLI
ncbi:hypothetical protein HDN1F_09080 [gamma proteobacterium HdN1]|nr:hypothetical protein HDN1F_09080 [gamma proteobacterium HdN1]